MNDEFFESSGHDNIALVRSKSRRILGYHVKGISGYFSSLAAALIARDGPDEDLEQGPSEDGPDNDRPPPSRGRSR